MNAAAGHDKYAFSTFDFMETAYTLRRAEMVLHRWAEEECNGTIQREGDQGDGKPFRNYGIGSRSHQIPDREAGALRRVAKVCKDAGLHYYHQTDPRGCALYVSTKPISSRDYINGVACSI